MSDLIIVAFDDEATAFEMRAELAKLQTHYALDIEDVVVVTRSANEKVQLHQVANLTALGAVSGGFWGAFIGLLFLNPFLGADSWAAPGAMSSATSEIGIDDEFMRDLGSSFEPGGAAVFFLSRKFTADMVIDRLGQFSARGRVLQTSLNQNVEACLRAALVPVAA